jgi:Tfp pilus assembly protein PilF
MRAPLMGFVYDDNLQVLDNPYIRSVSNIPHFFGGALWHGVWQGWRSYYRPLFLLWMLGNNSVFGLSPAGWHVTGLLLHGANCVLLYLLALRLTRERLPALFAGLVFGLHPVQVEVVSWVSASCELLGTFFSLAAFLCYLRALEPGARRTVWRFTGLTLYGAAAFSKETAIILPALVFLHEWLGRPASSSPTSNEGRREKLRGALRECAPFLAFAALYLAVRVAALGSIGQHASQLETRVVLGTLPRLLLTYLKHILWPLHLSLFYESSYVRQFSTKSVLLPLVMLVVAGILLWMAVRRSPAARLSLAWVLLPLLPVLDIAVFPRNEFLHDRYLYHPLVGVALLAGMAAAWAKRLTPPPSAARKLLLIATTAVLATLGFLTFRQTAYWMDNFSLYSHCYEVAPRNASAINNLGVELIDRGQLERAKTLFETGYRDNPDLWLAQYNLGRIYYKKGLYQEALAAFQKSLSAEPNYPPADMQLGMTQYRLGQLNLAIDSVKRAIALQPAGVGYHFALGILLKESGDLAGARKEFEEELKRDPNHQPSLEQLQLLDRPALPTPSSPAAKQ